jgi:hypothetical protein
MSVNPKTRASWRSVRRNSSRKVDGVEWYVNADSKDWRFSAETSLSHTLTSISKKSNSPNFMSSAAREKRFNLMHGAEHSGATKIALEGPRLTLLYLSLLPRFSKFHKNPTSYRWIVSSGRRHGYKTLRFLGCSSSSHTLKSTSKNTTRKVNVQSCGRNPKSIRVMASNAPAERFQPPENIKWTLFYLDTPNSIPKTIWCRQHVQCCGTKNCDSIGPWLGRFLVANIPWILLTKPSSSHTPHSTSKSNAGRIHGACFKKH